MKVRGKHRQNNSDNQSKKDDKDQETIQSSTTPDPGFNFPLPVLCCREYFSLTITFGHGFSKDT